jgi:hypothetical protein
VTTSDVKMTLLVGSDQADRAADAVAERMFFEE